MKVSDIVIDYLDRLGINTVFTVSGGGCIHLIDSLRKSNMEVICTHHEQAALIASEGYYRMSGKLAANIVTTGPGGTNALTGLLGLWLDSIPSIIISGQVATNQMTKTSGCRQIGDQEFDKIVKVVKPFTKYVAAVSNPYYIIAELEKAIRIAKEGRPGPVWLDIPLDVQGADINTAYCKTYSNYFHEKTKKSKYLKQEINNLFELLNKAKKPLVVVGSGIRLSNTYERLNAFLEKTGIPAVTGPHSGVDCVDNTLEYYCGRIGILGQLTSNKIVQECDLLIALGTRLPVKMTGYNVAEFSPNSKKVVVDIDNWEVAKHEFTVNLPIICDLKDFFKEVEKRECELDIKNWQEEVKSIRKEQKYVYPKHESLTDFVSFYYLISKAPSIFGNTPIVTSNGTAHVVTLQTYQLKKDQRLFTNVGCASMGYGLPAAVGACLVNNRKEVICIEGDGSIMMNLQELQTVKGYKLPVKVIIINNDGYLSIKMTQESFFKGQEFASGPETGVTFPSFKKIAYAFEIPYLSVRRNKDVEESLRMLMNIKGPCILEVFSHPKEKHEPKVTHKGVDNKGNIIPGSLTDMQITESF